jgi:ATP-dependent DNA helicase RecG
MSSEDQRTERKSSWRGEYLKWLCGFANAQGGVLEIGRNGKGQVVGIDDAARLKAVITYEDIVRVERFAALREALREAVLNALVHRDYMNTAPIQIRVYDDRLVLWNPAVLPEGWTQQTLLEPHTSQPHNPDVANTFFRAGEIEAWGRGIERMFAACREAKTPEPRIRFDAGGIWTEFVFSAEYLSGISGEPTREDAGETPVKTPDRILDMLASNPDLTLAEVAQAIDKSLSAVERASAKLVKQGRLRFVGPRKGGRWEVLGDRDE